MVTDRQSGREGPERYPVRRPFPSACALPASGPQLRREAPQLSVGVLIGWLAGCQRWRAKQQACALQHRQLLYWDSREERPGSILLEMCFRQRPP